MEEGTGRASLAQASLAVPLIGRECELELAEGLLRAARAGAGHLLVLEGPAGIGKTRLLDALVARAQGFELLRAIGSPLERGFPFGLAQDLLEPLLGASEDATAGEPGIASRHLVELTARLAMARPLLLVIDDVHWADEPSLRFLAHLCARVADLPMLVVLASGTAESGAADIGGLFGWRGERVTLATLTGAAVAELSAQADRGYGVEVAREVTRRLAAFGSGATSLAQAVAVLDGEARLRSVAALADLPVEYAAKLSDALTGAGLLASAAPLAFPAPVVRDGVYDAIAPSQRALMHGAAARLLAAAGASDRSIVAHLMLSEPGGDATAARVLRRAALEARAHGKPERAARMLDRALAEPPEESERIAVLLELGAVESRARLPGAESHLAQAQRHGGPSERGEAALELADLYLLAGGYREATSLLEVELAQRARGDDDLGEGDLGLLLRAELAACAIAANRPRPEGWWAHGLEDLRGSTPGVRALLAVAASGAALGGEPAGVTQSLADRALGVEALLGSGAPPPPAASMIALQALQTAEDPAAGERRLDAELAFARAAGSLSGEAAALALRSRNALARGALRQAELDARAALSLSREHGLGLPAPFALASLLEALLDQGRIADAERELGSDAGGEGGPDDLGRCLLVSARGRLRAAAGNGHPGLRDVLAAGARLLRAACSTPGLPWRSRAGLLAYRLDRREEAVRLIEDELALARRLGAPRPLGVALRAAALIAPPALQIELLRDSVETLRPTTARLDRARSLCDLGAALRRSSSRTRAREPLQEALQLAHECGAVALEQRARHELVVLGARPRRYAITGVEALTARERQAGELAAAGLTNREIAAAMSVTANTVEYHLTNAYRKLGIATRTALAAQLGERRDQPAVAMG
jgi:DNA-binding CsgD family transcriptional regulator